jgi:mannose-6-phosphate isomerase-like protein (cupin superfamily)
MPTSQEFEIKLKDEGFPFVYRWHDDAGTTYPSHQHQDKVTLYIASGGVEIVFPDRTITLKPGDRLDVPPQTPHTATVGPNGCDYIVGEMVEGDS